MNKKIILASASPRRRELLTQIGLEFEVVVSETEEKITSTEPAKVVEELSAQKAQAVWGWMHLQTDTDDNADARILNKNVEPCDIQISVDSAEACGGSLSDNAEKCADRTQEYHNVRGRGEKKAAAQANIVIGADTVVACDGKILGKPKTVTDAMAMLQLLQGRAHDVYTGVTILYDENGEQRKLTFHEKTTVHFCPMSEEEIREYVATGDPMDKAGAYGIQGFCARYIQGIEGDYNNVVGLPVGRVYQELRKLQLL